MRHIGYNLAFNTSGAFSKGSVCIHCAVYTISLTVEDLFSISTWFKSILFVPNFYEYCPSPCKLSSKSKSHQKGIGG